MYRFLLIYFLLFPLLARAENVVVEEDEIQTIYAALCEQSKNGENRSTTRARASDAACYKALDNLSVLSEYKNKYDPHDYKVLIYSLIDNYLEDLTIRTTSQDENALCIELTGYINKANIALAAEELAQKHEEKYPEQLMLEESALTEPSPNSLPPKPNIKIDEQIAMESIFDDTIPNDSVVAHKNMQSTNPKLFIERTQFFNNTSTNAFHTDIAQIMNAESQIEIVSSSADADYIIKSRVLRAKVEPINKKTNRLQMVVAVELENMQNNTTIREHQNRFILFDSSENEQNVAASLLKKLLRKATKIVEKKIEKPSSSIGAITPQNHVYNSEDN